VVFGLGGQPRPRRDSREWMAVLIGGLVMLQVAAGGFVAGLDAGMGYNTWPLMEGELVPQGLFVRSHGGATCSRTR
jgi:heme a synthase